jgi:MFS family permease
MQTKIFLDPQKLKVAEVDLAVLLFGFIDTFYIYIGSSYFSGIIGSDNVGFFYLVSYLASLLLFFFLQSFIRKLGQQQVLYLFLLLSLILVALLTNIEASFLGAGILLLFVVTSSVIWILFDILLQNFSHKETTGSVRGLNLTLLNFGVLLAPFLATQVLSLYGFRGVFLSILVLYSFLFIFCLVVFRNLPKQKIPALKFWHAFSSVVKKRDLLRSYFISFALYFFYAVMIIYMPLYLIEKGFDWDDLGIMFTIMLVPFVLIQYPLGRLADQKYGEKEMLLVALILTTITLIVIALAPANSFLFWTSILFLSRVGIAGVEVLKDTHFYRHIEAKDVDMIAFFRTSLPMANIAVAALATGMLAFLPLASIFWLTAAVFILVFMSTLYLVDSK